MASVVKERVATIAWRYMRRYKLTSANDWNVVIEGLANRYSGNPERTLESLHIPIRLKRSHRPIEFNTYVTQNSWSDIYDRHTGRRWEYAIPLKPRNLEICEGARLRYWRVLYGWPDLDMWGVKERLDRMKEKVRTRERKEAEERYKTCELCKSQNKVETRYYFFADFRGSSRDRNNYKRLCYRCHLKFKRLANRLKQVEETRQLIRTTLGDKKWQKASRTPANSASSSST